MYRYNGKHVMLVCKTKGHFNYISNLNRSNKIAPIRHLQGLP